MILATVHANGVLTINDSASAIVVAGSVKHETVKFLFPDNWKAYRKTAVFSAYGVEPVSIELDDNDNELYIREDECYIPSAVLSGDNFYVSVTGACGADALKKATTTKAKIEVL